MRRAIIAALVLCACAAPASAKDEAGDATAAEADKKDKDEMICRRVRVIGPHFKQRVCKTRGQMEAEREAAQRQAERYNEANRAGPSG